MVDAVEIEFPSTCAAENGGLDGDAIAYFPSESLGRAGAGDCALAIIQKCFPLIVGDDHFRENCALIFDVDRKLREEILFVLIDAAEPIVVRDRFDAGNGAGSCRGKASGSG